MGYPAGHLPQRAEAFRLNKRLLRLNPLGDVRDQHQQVHLPAVGDSRTAQLHRQRLAPAGQCLAYDRGAFAAIDVLLATGGNLIEAQSEQIRSGLAHHLVMR